MKLSRNIAFYAVALMLLLFASCKRDELKKSTPTDGSLKLGMNELVVPAGFNFQTERDILVRVGVGTTTYKDEKVRINIYIDEPSTGKLSVAGATNDKNEFTASMTIPYDLQYIYVEKQDVFGNRELQKVKTDNMVFVSFNGNQAGIPFIRRAVSGFDCVSGCTISYDNHVGDITVTSGQVACITGTFSGNITINGSGIAKVCATGNVDSFILNNDGRVLILETAVLTVNRAIFNSSTTEFTNWSDSLIVNHCMDINNVTENHGKFYVNCDVTVTSTGQFNNFGGASIAHDLVQEGPIDNYNTILVQGDHIVNAGVTYNNYCQHIVKTDMEVSGTVTTNSYIKVTRDLKVNSGAKITMQNGALISTTNLIADDEIKATGASISYIKVGSTTNINSGGKIGGKINLCDNDGVEVLSGTINTPAQLSCTGFLPTSSCNPEGFGTFIVQDADGDGVPDALDDYPNDPLRAFIRFYPCATTCSNMVFEDLWPNKGDYDFNDMIVAFNITKVYNANNKTVDYKIKAVPRAIGAGFDNAFGFSLDDVDAADVQTVTGQVISKNYLSFNANKTEAGQSKAVIICYDSPEPLLHRAAGSFFNTIKTNGKGTADSIYINVTFSSLQDDASVEFTAFNPFLIVNHNRGVEVHQPNHKPTDLVNFALFGTGADRSVPASGIYYKTAQGLPWAMRVPENLDYPAEKISITDAYNFFDDWAASGGTQFPNWYRNFGSYRNNDLLYE